MDDGVTRDRHKGGDISASTWRQACSYVVARRAGETEKAEYDPRARFSIITSFVPRYAKLYIVYIQGWWVGKQKAKAVWLKNGEIGCCW